MKITYIHHSSFLAELQRMTLLFDYFEGDIPALRADAPLLVFASHRHGDHFSPVIFELAKRHPQVYYILSDDIWRKRVPEELRERTWFMGPGETLELSWKEDGGLEYVTQMVDVSAWARRTGSQNPDLLDFEKWSYEYLWDLIKAQIRRQIKNLGETAESSMAAIYASVYMDYYAGREIDKEGVVQTKGYQWWLRNLPDSPLLKELDAMMADAKRDNNYALLPGI